MARASNKSVTAKVNEPAAGDTKRSCLFSLHEKA